MVNPINVSLGGLQTAAKRIEVASNNLANQNSTSTRVDGEATSDVYKPQRVVQDTVNGVPVARVETVANPTLKLYAPENPQADDTGFIDIPNVDTANELVELKIASYDYKANLKAIKVQDEVQQSLLDILT